MSSVAPTAADALVDLAHPIKTETAAWAAKALDPDGMIDRDRELEFDRAGWVACAEQGILGLTVEPEFGGSGAGIAETLLVLEGLGYGCRDTGLVFALTSQLFSAQVAVQRFGSEEQRRRWLPPMIAGEAIGAFAITEPDSGSDTYAMAATAVATEGGDGYVLDGHKAWITNAPVADVVVAFASTRPDAGRWGISAFLVPTDAEGVRIQGTQPKMGLRTTPFGTSSSTACGSPPRRGSDARAPERASSRRPWRPSGPTCWPARSGRWSASSTRRSPSPARGSNPVNRSVGSRPSRTASQR